MWLKQIKLFQLSKATSYSAEQLEEKLEILAFRPCLPSMPFTCGWVPPIQEDGMPLVQGLNGRLMICLQTEEKVLPATIIRQTLDEKIKQIEKIEGRNIRSKEKLSLKDEIIHTLLPRAFSKLSRMYAYIDIQHQWLVLGTSNAKKAEQFLSILKKSISEEIQPVEAKKFAPLLTHWLKHQDYPTAFSIGKACVLQDPEQKNRTIRCQQQNLFAAGIQSLIKEGCEAKQLALCWQDRVNFVLSADQFSLSGLQYQEAVIAQAKEMDAETKQQQFNADFLIMTETLSGLFRDLLEEVAVPCLA